MAYQLFLLDIPLKWKLPIGRDALKNCGCKIIFMAFGGQKKFAMFSNLILTHLKRIFFRYCSRCVNEHFTYYKEQFLTKYSVKCGCLFCDLIKSQNIPLSNYNQSGDSIHL